MSKVTYANGSDQTVTFAYYSNGPGLASGATEIAAISKIVRHLGRRSSLKAFLTWSVAPGGKVQIDGLRGIGDERCSPREGQRVVRVV